MKKLFGKPYKNIIKRPGALKAKAKAAGMSTCRYAKAHLSDPGLTGKQARLGYTLMKIKGVCK